MKSSLPLAIFRTISLTYAVLLTFIAGLMLYLNFYLCKSNCSMGVYITEVVVSLGIMQLIAHLISLKSKKIAWILLTATLFLNLSFNFYLAFTSPDLPLHAPLDLSFAILFNPAFPTAIPLFLLIYVLLLHKQFFAR